MDFTDLLPDMFAEDASQTPSNGGELPPEIVRQLTERVYALWLHDLGIERERWQQ